MGLGKVMDRRDRGGRSILIYDFVTNQHDLLSEHRAFLDRFASESHSLSVTWSVVGMASRLGDATGRGQLRNVDLSWERAHEVNNYILRRNMGAVGRNPSGISIPTINTRVAGVGTRLSDTTSDINSEYNRSVVIWNNVGIPEFRIEAEVPPRATTEFFIKYLGSGGIGEGGSFNYAQFVIRDGRSYWQRYSYGGFHLDVGAPVSFGEGVRAGEGWVRFRTRLASMVDSFSGWAQMAEAAVQVGEGVDALMFTFGFGRAPSRGGSPQSISVTCPTGPGFSLGVSAALAGGMLAMGRRQHGPRWRFL